MRIGTTISTERRRKMTEIKWETDFQAAVARSKKEGKPVLLDFFNPG